MRPVPVIYHLKGMGKHVVELALLLLSSSETCLVDGIWAGFYGYTLRYKNVQSHQWNLLDVSKHLSGLLVYVVRKKPV